VLSLWVGLEKVTELAEDQTESAREPSMAIGERVLREVIEPEEVTITVADWLALPPAPVHVKV